MLFESNYSAVKLNCNCNKIDLFAHDCSFKETEMEFYLPHELTFNLNKWYKSNNT